MNFKKVCVMLQIQPWTQHITEKLKLSVTNCDEKLEGAVSLTAKYMKEECHSEPLHPQVRAERNRRRRLLARSKAHWRGDPYPLRAKGLRVPLIHKRPFGPYRSASDMENGCHTSGAPRSESGYP